MPAPQRPQVLIVEDEPAVSRVFARILRAHGFDPVTAGDAIVAQGLLAVQRWDAVVIDVRLPDGASGLDVLRGGLARDPGLADRAIVTTGDLEPALRDQATALGCRVLLEKPFAAARLIEVVREVIEGDRDAGRQGRRHA